VSAEYDVIIVGGGHNGLTAAGYLQKAGMKVLVLERLSKAGGGVVSEEVTLPGFKHNIASQFHGIIHLGPVYKDLELEKFGARYVWPDAQFGLAMEDGRAAIVYRNLEKTCASIAQFSKRDAQTYRELAQQYSVILDNMLGPWFFNPPVPNSIANMALESSVEGLNMMRMQMSNTKNLITELFESVEVRSLLLGFIKEFGGSPELYGFGVFVPMMLGESHDPHGWAVCEGGSGNLAAALVKSLEHYGGTVKTNAHVKRILVEGKRATGVEMADGTKIVAKKLVLTNLEPHTTFMNLIGEDKLEAPFIKSVKRFRQEDMALFGVHLALDEPLDWKCAKFNPDVQKCLGMLVVKDPQALYDDFAEITMKQAPKHPSLLTLQPTAIDPTQAPAGKHTAFCWQWVPYELRNGGAAAWDEYKEEYADICLKEWGTRVNNLDKATLKRYVQSPLDIERRWPSMVHGGFNHGELTQDQLGVFRPFVEYEPYRTPFENLYMCGASTHPSGSVGGACGFNAVQAIAQDLKIKQWWNK